jgi:peptidyl-dipeptidase Dcp
VRAFELSGRALRHVLATFYNVKASHGTPEILDVHADIQRLVTAHQDSILLDRSLYDRLASCPTDEGLDGEDARLVSETLRRFRQAGADASAEDSGAPARAQRAAVGVVDGVLASNAGRPERRCRVVR